VHRQVVWENFRVMLSRYQVDPHDVTVISGTAAGADVMCESVAEAYGMTVERHPAKWNEHDAECPPEHAGLAVCKRAGYRRNAEMVATGADLCMAFIRDNSKGATMCADLAEKAGIMTVRFYG
jgi:transcriptional regulator GlxA family with amidase domain